MNEAEIKNIIYQSLKKIAPETEPSDLAEDENIREILNIDSFDYLQFIISLDEKLGVEIPEQDYGKITTIKELIEYLQVKPYDI
jgi:acyl carrier protein